MNEEINIIELLKRVKEGKEPKRIEIEGVIYERNTDKRLRDCVDLLYQHYRGVDEPIDWWIDDKVVTLDTKIKILDKPIIEELEIGEEVVSYGFNREHRFIYPTTGKICSKINEIIKYIDSKEE